VEFQHAKHVKALEKEGCRECHLVDEKSKKQSPRLKQEINLEDREEFAETYHGACIDCHQKRMMERASAGPEDCGDCHLPRQPARSLRMSMKFDYSLHYRHVEAQKEKCEKCHHIYNEKLKKLEYKKDTESACSDCHLDVDQEKNLSWRNAAHTNCISCHLENEAAKQKTGPTACTGCHDQVDRKKIKQLEKVPRLKRKQPDRVWILTPEAKFNRVAFDHQAHEPQTFNCSTCHHWTLKPCRECHSLEGSKEGDWVALEKAQHHHDSEYACVGCHKREAEKKECIGCHHMMMPPPGQAACGVCHSGPTPEKGPKTTKELPPEELFAEVKLAPLPAHSKEDLPEKLAIDIPGKEYQPTQFPHHKIVKKLDELARKSKLANRFHRKPEFMCYGCHHHSPAGQRPPPCKSCHGNAAHPVKDLPMLKSAYHRQCIGCHQRINHKAQGCTDCHKKKAGEAKEASR
jgi:hypothetical protein